MKTTRYFEAKLRDPQRPYLTRDLCERVVRQPLSTEVQPDGRICHWAWVPEDAHYSRVITEPDGETLLNAFRDRRYRGGAEDREGPVLPRR